MAKHEDNDLSGKVSTPPKPQPQPTSLSLPLEMSLSKETPPRLLDVADTPGQSRRAGRARNHVRGYMDHVMTGSPSVKRTPPGSPSPIRFTHGLANPPFLRIHSYTFPGNPAPMTSGIDQSASFNRFIQDSPVELGDNEGQVSYVTLQTTSSGPPGSSVGADTTSYDSSHLHERHRRFLNRRYCSYPMADSLLEESLEILPGSQPASTIDQFSLSRSPPAAHIRNNQFEPRITPSRKNVFTLEPSPMTPIVG
ncbi:hypothetical protein V8B97DRAFT_2004900 [Scleroderma yunnanense]